MNVIVSLAERVKPLSVDVSGDLPYYVLIVYVHAMSGVECRHVAESAVLKNSWQLRVLAGLAYSIIHDVTTSKYLWKFHSLCLLLKLDPWKPVDPPPPPPPPQQTDGPAATNTINTLRL